ncbi:MAG: tRNA pseudouridine(54/55) synthase Pus10 [Promethearchaeota archaeon]
MEEKELRKEKDTDDLEEKDIPIKFTNVSPSIYQKTIELLKYNKLCNECLGRQFSYLGTATSNSERAQAIFLGITMECNLLLLQTSFQERFNLFGQDPIKILDLLVRKANFLPAKKVLEQFKKKEFLFTELKEENEIHASKCQLCDDLLLPEKIDEICEKIDVKAREYEFTDFLIGTHLNALQADKEDELRVKFKLKNGESFKANINRLIGKKLQDLWKKQPNFNHPSLMITINLEKNGKIDINFRAIPLYFKGRYKKWVRDLPQTHWHCFKCRGKGIDKFTGEICSECGGTGDKYSSSIQDLIGEGFLNATQGETALFHGAGREDIDARCLGMGRTFIIEIKNPKIRDIDLLKTTRFINERSKAKIFIDSISTATKQDIIEIKSSSEFLRKIYHALIYFAQPISQTEFEEKMIETKKQLNNTIINQRTPLRVVHRRSDRTRKKKIFTIQGKYIDPKHGFFKISTQGGTYIKELIHGDNGRTNPSLSRIFGYPMICVELDVVEIEEK